MARLKFLVFALVVLGLWATQLFLLAPAFSAQAVEQGLVTVKAAQPLVATRLDARRAEVQRVVMKAAGSLALVTAFPAPRKGADAEALDADKLREVRKVVAAGAPEALRRELVVAVSTEQGALAMQGEGEPKALAAGLDAAALARAGGDGVVQEAFGDTHVFYSFPVVAADRSGEMRTVATVVVGAPLLPSGILTEASRAGGFSALAVLKDGKQVGRAAGDGALADATAKALKPGGMQVVSQGSLSALGPFHFPLLTADDTTGGRAPLAVGTRQALEGTPFEVVAAVSTRPAQHVLAGFQRMTLFGFAGLLGLTLVFALLLGTSARAAGEQPLRSGGDALSLMPAELPPQPLQAEQPWMAAAAGGQPFQAPQGEVLPFNPPGAPPAVSPADADWGSPSSAPSDNWGPPPPVPSEGEWNSPPPAQNEWSAPPVQQEQFQPPAPLGDDFFNQTQPAGASPFQEPPQQGGLPSFDTLTTRAYPVPQAALETLAQQPVTGGMLGSNPETTRVSPIPDELLRASAEEPAPFDPPPMDAEEQHFQDVFRDFVATREKCGEPADGLTYDKFVQKLRKNKEQLVAKYNCRTVRFVVYVKEGKAALKATPVKD